MTITHSIGGRIQTFYTDYNVYQLQPKPAHRRMFTLRENLLFCEKWTRSFELETLQR
jgi:hypothetical protein